MTKKKGVQPPLKVIEGDRKSLERKLLYEVALGQTSAETAGKQLDKKGDISLVIDIEKNEK